MSKSPRRKRIKTARLHRSQILRGVRHDWFPPFESLKIALDPKGSALITFDTAADPIRAIDTAADLLRAKMLCALLPDAKVVTTGNGPYTHTFTVVDDGTEHVQ